MRIDHDLHLIAVFTAFTPHADRPLPAVLIAGQLVLPAARIDRMYADADISYPHAGSTLH